MINKSTMSKDEQTSFCSFDGIICEEIYNSNDTGPLFAVWNGSSVEYKAQIEQLGKTIRPINDEVVLKRLVKLPTRAEPYDDEKSLFSDIRDFIHKYVDIETDWETFCTCYVLLSWVYDKLPVIPYLCLLGPPETGKTRTAQVLGSICYKPFFASGAITASPIFRILDRFGGTLIINEFDHLGDLHSEIIIVLNNGYEAGLPVIRTEGDKNKQVKAFNVFGPKIFASRQRKDDWAFGTRLITIPTVESKRLDIPPFLVNEFHNEAELIRNKLLYFRFKHYFKETVINNELFPSLRGRIRQTLLSLASVIKNDAFLEKLQEFGEKQAQDIKSARSFDLDNIIFQILKESSDEDIEILTVKEITEKVKEISGYDKLTPRTVGAILRDELGFTTKRGGANGNYVVHISKHHIASLSSRYGTNSNSVSSDSSVDEAGVTELTERSEQKDQDQVVDPQDLPLHLQKYTDEEYIEKYLENEKIS